MQPSPADLRLAFAKLTLDLQVVGTRSDGYHLISAEMVTISLADELRIDPVGAGEGAGVLEVTGPAAAGVGSGPDNLVARALAVVGRRARVRLVKNIPAGAGLGGGSADAAAVLRWAGCWDPEVAASVGADVAFCLRGGRARVSGIGEVLDPLPFRPGTFTLLTPPVAVSTVEVYRRWDHLGGPRGAAGNDLEAAALDVAPELARWRDELARASGRRPRLAGSGSTWYVEGAYPGPGLKVVHTVEAVPAPGDGGRAPVPSV